jgi:hypothetical protein
MDFLIKRIKFFKICNNFVTGLNCITYENLLPFLFLVFLCPCGSIKKNATFFKKTCRYKQRV